MDIKNEIITICYSSNEQISFYISFYLKAAHQFAIISII